MATHSPRLIQATSARQRAMLANIAAHKSNYWVGFVTDPAVAVFYLIWDIAILRSRIVICLGCYAIGLLGWTLFEYCFHRWIYHSGKSLAHVGHQMHHESPRILIGMPWFLTTGFLLCLWYFFGYLLRLGTPLSLMSGLVTGFNVYGAFHHIHHHFDVKQSWYRKLKIHHKIHHQYPNVNFGVTSPVWDHIFGTTYFDKYGRTISGARRSGSKKFLSLASTR